VFIAEMQPYLLEREGAFDSVLGLPIKLVVELLAQADSTN